MSTAPLLSASDRTRCISGEVAKSTSPPTATTADLARQSEPSSCGIRQMRNEEGADADAAFSLFTLGSTLPRSLGRTIASPSPPPFPRHGRTRSPFNSSSAIAQ